MSNSKPWESVYSLSALICKLCSPFICVIFVDLPDRLFKREQVEIYTNDCVRDSVSESVS